MNRIDFLMSEYSWALTRYEKLKTKELMLRLMKLEELINNELMNSTIELKVA